jgi:pimeloyl-ACP methyl ester carboxylesterase
MRTVLSSDGTRIACWTGGRGQNLVLVHGTAASSSRWATIRPRFEERFTVTAIDRRGRGESSDAPDYTIEREFDDVAAVVEAVDSPVLLFGHSYGAICALEAALRTDRLMGLVLYEPPIVAEGETVYSQEQLGRFEALLAADDRDGVVTTFMGEIVGLPPQELERLKSSPAWPGRVAAAHTLPRELRAQEAYRLNAERAARLSIPVLLLLGGDSPTFFGNAIATLEQALPDSRTVVMHGQQHVAMDTAPDLVVGAVLDFWLELERTRLDKDLVHG